MGDIVDDLRQKGDAVSLRAADYIEFQTGRIATLKIAIANLVDRDFTYVEDCVAGGQIPAKHIHDGRDAIRNS